MAVGSLVPRPLRPNGWATPLALVVVPLLMGLSGAACGRQHPELVKQVQVRPATAGQALLMRLERAYRRCDVAATLDCLDKGSYRKWPRAEANLMGIFRHASDMQFQLYRGEVRSSPDHLDYEVTWSRTYEDYFSRKLCTAKGAARVVVSVERIPRILEVLGDDPLVQ